MRNNFVTIFLRTESVHLRKDIGMIPFTMSKKFFYSSKIVTLKKKEHPPLTCDLKGVEIEYIDGDASMATKRLYEYRIIKSYILKYAKYIDVLNLYHISLFHFILMWYYKKKNKNGITYLKLDNNDIATHKLLWDWVRFSCFRLFSKKVDIISTETRSACVTIEKQLHHPVLYVPNGSCMIDNVQSLNFHKENIFLTVGRIGASIKNTDLIVEAFSKIYRQCDWNLMLVGYIEPTFKSWMEGYCSNYDKLSERIILTGEISKVCELKQIYQKSKIFIMVSKRESFSIAVAEAQSQGNYLILSENVAPHDDFTNDGKFGITIPANDADSLAKAMLAESAKQHDYLAYARYCQENFNWNIICKRIDFAIKGARDSMIKVEK